MNNLRILLALALSFLPLAEASAGNGTITTKDAGGVTRTFSIVTDGSGNFIARQVICDQSAAATCASVGTAGSPSTNAVTVQAVTLGAGTAANAMRVELPTDGTGKVTAAQATAANLNATVVGTGTFAVQNNTAVIGQTASGSALSGNPVRIGLSDGTNAQNWLTALPLGDGVNGNNTAAVAGWMWNGTTYDRITGTAALGQYVQAKSAAFASGSFASGAFASGSHASGSFASGAFAPGSVASGAMVDLGAQADAVCGTATGTCSLIALQKYNNSVSPILSAGTAIIGKVGIDQTTPGTTNGMSPSLTNAVWGTTSAMTGTTSTSLIAGTSSKVTYVTALFCGNSHATVGTFVTVQDGSGGTTLGTVAAAAVFGGTVLQAGGAPLFPPTTSGNGVFVADVTTGANVICTGSGFHS